MKSEHYSITGGPTGMSLRIERNGCLLTSVTDLVVTASAEGIVRVTITEIATVDINLGTVADEQETRSHD